jgi:hypothetical protein
MKHKQEYLHTYCSKQNTLRVFGGGGGAGEMKMHADGTFLNNFSTSPPKWGGIVLLTA